MGGQICFLITPCSCGFCHLHCQILLYNSPDNGFYINSGNYSDSPSFDGTSIASFIWELLHKKEILQPQACQWENPTEAILTKLGNCSSEVFTWWWWVLVPPNVYIARSPLWTYVMIWYSLLERKAMILKHQRWMNETADLFPIYRFYNSSYFLNILGSSGLGKQIKLISLHTSSSSSLLSLIGKIAKRRWGSCAWCEVN